MAHRRARAARIARAATDVIDREQLDRWMTAAAEGDRAAVDPLFAALWPLATRYAARFLGDAALGEDCAQDALVRLFGQIDRYDRTRDALAWALTHVTWQCRSARRTRERRGEVAETIDDAGFDLRVTVEDRELVRAALATLATLGERDVEVIAAAVLDDDTLRDALAPATFRKRLERALARLRTSWRSRHETL
jgi:RNA polymerase sigma-70 factor, ECF subfamily